MLYSIKRFCRVSLHLPYTIVIIIYEFTEPIPSSLFTAPSTLDAIMDHDMSAGEARKNYISLKIAWYNNEPGLTLYQYTIATGCRYRHRLTTAATIWTWLTYSKINFYTATVLLPRRCPRLCFGVYAFLILKNNERLRRGISGTPRVHALYVCGSCKLSVFIAISLSKKSDSYVFMQLHYMGLLSVQENQLIVLLIYQTLILFYSYILPLHVVYLSLIGHYDSHW